MKVWTGALAVVLIVGISSYSLGKHRGVKEGFEDASSQYDLWAIGLMYRNPDRRLDSIMLVPDGARIKLPTCQPDEEIEAFAARRPEWGKMTAINGSTIERDGDVLVVSFPDNKSESSRAAALVGCRKKNVPPTRDLTRSWELPSTLR